MEFFPPPEFRGALSLFSRQDNQTSHYAAGREIFFLRTGKFSCPESTNWAQILPFLHLQHGWGLLQGREVTLSTDPPLNPASPARHERPQHHQRQSRIYSNTEIFKLWGGWNRNKPLRNSWKKDTSSGKARDGTAQSTSQAAPAGTCSII